MSDKSLAIFDFDGTLTTKDTLLEFIKFVKGRVVFTLGFVILSPYLVAMKLGLYPNWKAKEKVLHYFFKGATKDEFNQWGETFCDEVLPHYLRDEALERMKFHCKQGDKIYIISASAENWVNPWAIKINIPLIATRLEFVSDKFSGRILGKNCFGIEKINRLKEIEDTDKYDHIYAYGDSAGDSHLLELASKPHYRVFK